LDVTEIAVARALGFEIILDVIEPFSLAAREYPLRIYGARPWFLWLMKELICYRLSNFIIVVCPEYAPWVRARSRTDPIVVENFPDVNVFKLAKSRFEDFSVVYFGGSSPSRSLAAVGLASQTLKNELGMRFHLIGPPNLARSLEFVDYYHGYLSDEEAASIIGMCHVGVAPYLQNAHTRFTLPNKYFQYAACGVLPVGPQTVPLSRFSEICVLIRSNDSSEWSAALRRAYEEWRRNPVKLAQLRGTLIEKGWTSSDVWEACIERIVKRSEASAGQSQL
jgi:hypothetical protein